MALNVMHRIQFHRWGRFTHDGRAFTYAFVCWALTSQLQEAGHWGGDGAPDCYGLPLDDHQDDWLRLEAEAWARDHHPHPDTGKPHGLVHSGGIFHPDPRLKHIKLGGTLHWEHDPHPLVQQRLGMLQALDFDGLVQFFCGPDPFRGVIAGGL